MAAGSSDVFLSPRSLQTLLAENAVEVLGAVRVPGRYPIYGAITMADLVAAAGGPSVTADLNGIEVTASRFDRGGRRLIAERQTVSLAMQGGTLVLNPGDSVLVPQLGNERIGHIELAGEVWRPGRYDLVNGETLSDVIARAGGLKDLAYPQGTVFTRQSVRDLEKQSFERVASDLDRNLAAFMTTGAKGEQGITAESAVAVRGLMEDIRKAEPVGRVVVEADPAILKVHPEQDILMEPGDRIFIPRRPLFVMVSGEVLNAGAQQFTAGSKASDYVDRAGGMTQFADQGRVFVVYPNGQAQAVGLSSWNFNDTHIPPGSTIVVPRDLDQLSFMTLSQGITDVLSKLAVSLASLAVISK